MLRDGHSKAMENMTQANPMANMPGFEAMQAQQQAFFKAMTGGMMGATAPKETDTAADDLDTIKQQLAAMQEKLSKMGK
jgi:polyhydroxyalkanoate synthesis regulator protein